MSDNYEEANEANDDDDVVDYRVDVAQDNAEQNNDSESSDLQDEANEMIDDEECEEEESKDNKIIYGD